MKSKITNLIGIASFVIVAAVASAFAQENRALGGGRLAGTWEAVVTIQNCATGATIATFSSIANFEDGGTFLGSTSGIPQSLRTPEHGVWSHDRGNIYRFKFKTFSFLPTGAPNGWSIVEHDVELDRNAHTYTSSGRVRFFSPDGTQTGQGCSSAVGTRFEL